MPVDVVNLQPCHLIGADPEPPQQDHDGVVTQPDIATTVTARQQTTDVAAGQFAGQRAAVSRDFRQSVHQRRGGDARDVQKTQERRQSRHCFLRPSGAGPRADGHHIRRNVGGRKILRFVVPALQVAAEQLGDVHVGSDRSQGQCPLGEEIITVTFEQLPDSVELLRGHRTDIAQVAEQQHEVRRRHGRHPPFGAPSSDQAANARSIQITGRQTLPNHPAVQHLQLPEPELDRRGSEAPALQFDLESLRVQHEWTIRVHRLTLCHFGLL